MLELYKRIRQERENKGLSQEQLAKMVGYRSKTTIAKIESGWEDETETQKAPAINDANIDYEEAKKAILNRNRKKGGIELIGFGAGGLPVEDTITAEEFEEIRHYLAIKRANEKKYNK